MWKSAPYLLVPSLPAATYQDQRDPEGALSIGFELLESDVLSHFSGTWALLPTRDASGRVVGCKGQLRQDILPGGKEGLLRGRGRHT